MEANKNDSESNELGPYFRIGVSRDYILIRNDFPVASSRRGMRKTNRHLGAVGGQSNPRPLPRAAQVPYPSGGRKVVLGWLCQGLQTLAG